MTLPFLLSSCFHLWKRDNYDTPFWLGLFVLPHRSMSAPSKRIWKRYKDYPASIRPTKPPSFQKLAMMPLAKRRRLQAMHDEKVRQCELDIPPAAAKRRRVVNRQTRKQLSLARLEQVIKIQKRVYTLSLYCFWFIEKCSLLVLIFILILFRLLALINSNGAADK